MLPCMADAEDPAAIRRFLSDQSPPEADLGIVGGTNAMVVQTFAWWSANPANAQRTAWYCDAVSGELVPVVGAAQTPARRVQMSSGMTFEELCSLHEEGLTMGPGRLARARDVNRWVSSGAIPPGDADTVHGLRARVMTACKAAAPTARLEHSRQLLSGNQLTMDSDVLAQVEHRLVVIGCCDSGSISDVTYCLAATAEKARRLGGDFAHAFVVSTQHARALHLEQARWQLPWQTPASVFGVDQLHMLGQAVTSALGV